MNKEDLIVNTIVAGIFIMGLALLAFLLTELFEWNIL